MYAVFPRSGLLSEVVDLLRHLVRHETCDPPGREIDIARMVHDRLGSSGLESELDAFEPGRANVIARVRGGGDRPAIVFSAHFDTVPPGEQPWIHDPFAAEIVDGKLYGRGSADMKSGMAAMIVAAERLAASGDRLGGDVVLALSAGESSNALGARRMVETGALDGCGALLVSEPSTMDVLLAEKGALWVRLIAHGKLGHRSGDETGTGGQSAIERMLDALVSLRSFHFDVPDHPLLGAPLVNVGTIRGGTVVNLTPDRCEAGVDLRILPGMDPSEAEQALLAHVGTDLELERMDFKPPVETAVDHPFARICLDAVTTARGRPAVPGGASYYSDASVLAPAFDIPMVIIGPGLLGMSGQTDEHVETADVEAAVAVFEQVARNWLSGGDDGA
ncbi:MAG: M20 family metallopeptidase [Rhodospirillales bacterium]|nr:M20 family metallopeptidase [Rhodospirillales bacterium]